MSSLSQPYSAEIVIPCYNEEDALPVTAPKILSFFKELISERNNNLKTFVVTLVDDGSSDRTWEIILQLAEENPEIRGIKLSRNFGHQAAMLSGLSQANADVIITMDADLQDDINAIRTMLAEYERGAHLALGVRNDRTTDSSAKRGTANAYYRLLTLLGIRIIENHADFRLMSRKALAALLQHQEVNLFLRGLIPAIGFPVVQVPYKRNAREQGTTKYTVAKMLRLAVDGVTSFSVAPLRMIALAGGLVFFGTILVGLYVLSERLFSPHNVVPGWASTVLPILLLGGLQLLSIGVLGEYVGKIYMEVKRRPRFIVQETTDE